MAHTRRAVATSREEVTVSIKRRLHTLLLCVPLLLGAFIGAPMRPEDVEDLMHTMNEQKIAFVLSEEKETGDEPLPRLPDLDP